MSHAGLASPQRERRPRPGWRALLVGALGSICALLFLLAPASAASATSSTGDDLPYAIFGNVQLNGEPLEGVEIAVTGTGVDETVTTDAAGQWEVGVAELGTYNVAIDESTLPEGIAVTEGDPEREAEVTAAGIVAVNFFIGEGERNTVSLGEQLLDRVINGLNFGLMLALAAVGLSLVFGTTGLSNFAHAEMVTLGAISGFLLVQSGIPAPIALLLAVGVGALFGLLMDAGIWRPLRRRGTGTVQLMIVSIGLSLALRYLFQFVIGGGTEQLPTISLPEIPLIGRSSINALDLISMGVSIIVIVAFGLWLTRSRMGKATRAISDNPSLAAASGIDVDRVVRRVWIIAGALAALAGVLYAYYRPGLRWDMGTQVLLLIFAAVTLGGLGTAFGALIGAIIVGVLTEVSSLWVPADLRFAFALVILIVILLFRPQGILGRKTRIG